jgi:hypothetical protein
VGPGDRTGDPGALTTRRKSLGSQLYQSARDLGAAEKGPTSLGKCYVRPSCLPQDQHGAGEHPAGVRARWGSAAVAMPRSKRRRPGGTSIFDRDAADMLIPGISHGKTVTMDHFADSVFAAPGRRRTCRYPRTTRRYDRARYNLDRHPPMRPGSSS